MAITPNTNLKLLQVPIEIDNKNQLSFNNINDQFNYFNNLPNYIEVDKISYIRKDNSINFPANIDSIINFNYCMYQNENYNDKWFYAFITKMEFINNSMTKIYITTDVFQTWQFDFNFKQSFVEREMLSTADDIPGANLLPESLETGEFKIGGTAGFDELEPVYIIAYMGDKFGEQDISQQGYKYNGIYSAVTFFVTNTLYVGLNTINHYGQGQNVLTVFSVPKLAVLDFIPKDTETQRYYYCTPLQEDFKQSEIFKTLISTPENLDGYVPKNQKLRTYPYMYLGFNAQNGTPKIYRYENFANGTPKFKLISEINPNPTINFIPQNYRGAENDSLGDTASMTGYPTISYKTDYYNTWLAQNSQIISLNMEQEQFNYETNTIKTAMQGTGQILNSASAGSLSALTDGATLGIDLASQDKNHEFYIAQQMAQIEKQKLLPNTASLSGSNSTLLGYDLLDNNIFTRYTIKNQFAKRIDKFFDLYGYLTNELKLPNLKNRPNWNYVKTIGANIVGSIPQEDMQLIKNMFNNGITIWHNANTFLDYSQNNR